MEVLVLVLRPRVLVLVLVLVLTKKSYLHHCFVQLKTLAPSARYSTFKYPVTLKPGLGVKKGHRIVIVLSHTVSEISAISVENRQFFPPRVLNAPDEGFPFEFGIGARGSECFYGGATIWSKQF